MATRVVILSCVGAVLALGVLATPQEPAPNLRAGGAGQEQTLLGGLVKKVLEADNPIGDLARRLQRWGWNSHRHRGTNDWRDRWGDHRKGQDYFARRRTQSQQDYFARRRTQSQQYYRDDDDDVLPAMTTQDPFYRDDDDDFDPFRMDDDDSGNNPGSEPGTYRDDDDDVFWDDESNIFPDMTTTNLYQPDYTTIPAWAMRMTTTAAPTSSSSLYPSSWGQPPMVQSMDYVPLAGGYGYGSSSLSQWIKEHMLADKCQRQVQYPPAFGSPPLAQTMDLVKLPFGYGQGSSSVRDWLTYRSLSVYREFAANYTDFEVEDTSTPTMMDCQQALGEIENV